MFRINFKAFDDFDELKLLSEDEFDNDYGDIEGVLELDFDGNKFGYYFDDCPFGEEKLIRWFEDLLTVVIKLKSEDYIGYRIPETPKHWLEFVKDNNQVFVSLVEDIERESLNTWFITEPLNEFKYNGWKNIEIDKQNLINETIIKVDYLLHFISVLNPRIYKSNRVKKILQLKNDVL